MTEKGTLKNGRPHPSTSSALDYINGLGINKLSCYLESYSSCAIEGNEIGEICGETLRRLLFGEPVSDRYLLGLAWNLKVMEESND
jgi:hypothetical protein